MHRRVRKPGRRRLSTAGGCKGLGYRRVAGYLYDDPMLSILSMREPIEGDGQQRYYPPLGAENESPSEGYQYSQDAD